MTSPEFVVIGGPSKFDLEKGLFVWNPRRPVIFNANCPVGTSFEVYILSVQAFDGSGEHWNIEGMVGDVNRPPRAGSTPIFLPESGQRVFIRYRTDCRQGGATFFENGNHKTLAAFDQVVQRVNEEMFGDGRPVRR